MTPAFFYTSPDSQLDHLSFIELGATSLLIASQPNQISFSWSTDLASAAIYKLIDGRLRIASPFGSLDLPADNCDPCEPISLLLISPDKGSALWTISPTAHWADEDGHPVGDSGDFMKLTVKNDLVIPMHSYGHIRAQNRGLAQWATVFLPAAPDRIYETAAGASIWAGGCEFTIPPGDAARLVLANKVRWGIPTPDGVFALSSMPS